MEISPDKQILAVAGLLAFYIFDSMQFFLFKFLVLFSNSLNLVQFFLKSLAHNCLEVSSLDLFRFALNNNKHCNTFSVQ